jgi:hypothetical protein
MCTFYIVDLFLGFVLNVLFLNVHVALDLFLSLQLIMAQVLACSAHAHVNH